MNKRANLESFSPGDYLREELEARGWTQIDLAEITSRTPATINEIVLAKRSITPDTAQSLADAFGTSPELWMNLETAYQLSKRTESDPNISKRARIYSLAPVNEMKKRGWIDDSKNVDVLEQQVVRFFELKSIDDKISFAHAAKKSTDYGSVLQSQLAWLYRARYLARAVPVSGQFNTKSLQLCRERLTKLKAEPLEIRHIPNVLAESGIRFLVVEHLFGTKIDGASFWLDRKSPVIAISLRYGRIDWFWQTLMHEIDHIANGEGYSDPTVDIQLVGTDAQPFDQKSAVEKRADQSAASFMVDQSALSNFIARVGPLYSYNQIQRFAAVHRIHPGIVIGQLQFRRAIKYTHGRAFLVQIREIITSSSLTDGWGHMLQI
jgi:HTH-type transcriptional regulator/antitoxin HigA